MRIWISIGAVLLLAVVLVSLFVNKSSAPTPDVTSLASGTVIYDVRTAEEFAESHVRSATLLPVLDIEDGKLPDVALSTPIAVYCRSGNRSSQATELLRKAGFTNITDLGGLDSLANYGLKAE